MTRKRTLLIASVVALAAAGTALATMGSGLTPNPNPAVRGTLDGNKKHEGIKAHAGHIKLDAKGPTDAAMQTITFAPGATSGWHSHPGVVLVVIQSGTLTRYNANCETTQYGPGAGFVEFGDHAGLVRNNSTTTSAVVYVTYIVPKNTASLRNDQPQPTTCAAS